MPASKTPDEFVTIVLKSVSYFEFIDGENWIDY